MCSKNDPPNNRDRDTFPFLKTKSPGELGEALSVVGFHCFSLAPDGQWLFGDEFHNTKWWSRMGYSTKSKDEILLEQSQSYFITRIVSN